MDEAALLAALREGDERAYEVLVRTHGGRMLSTARKLLEAEQDARDAVQDAFLSAFRSIDDFRGESGLGTWLHRIVVNAALMKVRARRRKPEQSIEDLLPAFLDDGHRDVPADDWRVTGQADAERLETRELVRGCICKLPESHRNVIVLRDIEGMSTEEAANMLGLTPNAVKLRLHRARQALRTLLVPHFRGSRR